MKKKTNFLSGLIAGVAAGAAAALLLTPKKGKDTREMIAGQASNIKDLASGPVSTLRERASGPVSSIKGSARRRNAEPEASLSPEPSVGDSANGASRESSE